MMSGEVPRRGVFESLSTDQRRIKPGKQSGGCKNTLGEVKKISFFQEDSDCGRRVTGHLKGD